MGLDMIRDYEKEYKDTLNIKEKKSTSIVWGTVPFLKIDKYNECEEVLATFSTRLGGVSTGQFTSMNFCTPLGDSIENVRKNFELYSKASLHKNFMLTKQTHTTNVLKVEDEYIGMGLIKERTYDNIDGLITNKRNVTLSTFYADCVPLYFYDGINHAIGLSHAGWRGTVNNIAKATIDKMNQEFGTMASDLICAIGPSICVNCYEISEDVAIEFMNAYSIEKKDLVKLPKGYDAQKMDKILFLGENDKYYLNLWAANYKNFVNAGVKPENIGIPDMCTCENSSFLFSHRALKGKRGNLGAFLMLKM